MAVRILISTPNGLVSDLRMSKAGSQTRPVDGKQSPWLFNGPVDLLIGELLFKGGSAVEALAHYDRMAELFRPDLATMMNRGLLARQLRFNSMAALRFVESPRLAPDRIQLHYLLGGSARGIPKSPVSSRKKYCPQ